MITEAIAAYLADNGIKQIYLAEKTGIGVQALRFSLRGKRRMSVEEYQKVCDVLNLPYDYFFRQEAD